VESQHQTASEKKWLQLRLSLLKNIKQQVRLYLGEEPLDLKVYGEAYRDDVERSFSISSTKILEDALERSDIVLGGDFHAFPQAQRSHLRILRRLASKRKIHLAMEIFQPSDQLFIDRFLGGQIDADELRQAVKWDELWGFPWKSYLPLLRLAKKTGMAISGINKVVPLASAQGLKDRDQFSAQEILKITSEERQLKGKSVDGASADCIYILFGDLHIATPHLEKALLENGGSSFEICKIFLNPEKAYFQLAEQNKESSTEVIAFSDRDFAIIGSPPWVKWQSYLMFLEENFDYDLEDDWDEDFDDDDWDEDDIDDTDHVLKFVRLIASALGVEINENHLEVYSSQDYRALEKAHNYLASQENGSVAEFLISSDRSFYLPEQNFFYLSKRTANHVATLAAQYIHSRLARRTRLLWQFPGDFYGLIWVEAMGFFLSKFINPKRKAPSMDELRRQLSIFHPMDEGREPLLLALDQRMRELRYLFGQEVTQPQFQGQRYFDLFQKNKIDRDQILERVQQDPSVSGFDDFYFKELQFLDRIEKA